MVKITFFTSSYLPIFSFSPFFEKKCENIWRAFRKDIYLQRKYKENINF